MAHDGLCGVTSGSPSRAETQLTATLGQLTLFDGSPVRVAGLARARVCAMEREKMCVSVSPRRASTAGWRIGWHVNYSAFKKGCPASKWLEGWWLCGGQGGCLWGKTEPVEGGHMWNALWATQVSNHGAIPGVPTIFPPSLVYYIMALLNDL